MKKLHWIFIFAIALILIVGVTTAASANGAPPPPVAGWCAVWDGNIGNWVWVPCPGSHPWDPYECGYYGDCQFWIQVCDPGGEMVQVPTYAPAYALSANDPWWRPGSCISTCNVISTQQDRLGIPDGPPRYTKVIYKGVCSYAVATQGNGYSFVLPGGLWFDANRDFQWIDYNGQKVKQSWFTNPVGSGEFVIKIYGSNGIVGGVLGITNP